MFFFEAGYLLLNIHVLGVCRAIAGTYAGNLRAGVPVVDDVVIEAIELGLCDVGIGAINEN
jgi:hypothetical protein